MQFASIVTLAPISVNASSVAVRCSLRAPAIVTLEHPILSSEWAANSPSAPTGKVKIGFVGHARRAKGFDLFVELAGSCSRDDIEFHVIGHSSPETDHLDTSKLARTPSKMPLLR